MRSKSGAAVLFFAITVTSGAGYARDHDHRCDVPAIPCGGAEATCSPEVRAYELSILETSVFRKEAALPLKPLSYPVQAVNFTNYTGWADGKEGQTVTLSRDLWFTVEPEVQTLCRDYHAHHHHSRIIPELHRLLGLKPATDADAGRKFVLFTIAQEETTGPTGKGVFRPCADPDPGATRCDNVIKGPEGYVQWFSQNMVSSYKLDASMDDTGYPWTRLGYTYNWDPRSHSHRGAQEYVAPTGTQVQIRTIVTPEQYCR
jgi:hypothetical protein